MTNPQSAPEQKSIEMLAFELYLRTGRRFDISAYQKKAETKFNPYHDPDNGQFTTATGAGFIGQSSSTSASAQLGVQHRDPLRNKRTNPGTQSQPAVPLRISQRKNDGRPIPTLSPLHNTIRAEAVKHPPESGTIEWTSGELIKWLAADDDIFAFKQQWVHGYRNAIKAAARHFDLPPALLAGVAFTEVGGDPLAIDRLAYDYRSLTGDAKRDRTSFGNLSVQFRRAALALGYNSRSGLTSRQREMVIASLQDAQTNIFIAAKHLSDLRNVDFRGVTASKFSRYHVEVIATRYNRGH